MILTASFVYRYSRIFVKYARKERQILMYMTATLYSPFMKRSRVSTLYRTHLVSFSDSEIKQDFENIVRKGENAGNQHFLLFQQCFQPDQRQKPSDSLCKFSLLSSNVFELMQSKILSFGLERIERALITL